MKSGSDESAVRQINELFYRALSVKDLSIMEAVWAHEPGVRCIHPGWDLLEGWEMVRESWSLIFRNPVRLLVTPSEIVIRKAGDMAWVSCLETIKAGNAVTLARATNLYVRARDGWKMILHHASQVSPGAASGPDEEAPPGSTVH
jgi:hypothetical protein